MAKRYGGVEFGWTLDSSLGGGLLCYVRYNPCEGIGRELPDYEAEWRVPSLEGLCWLIREGESPHLRRALMSPRLR